MNQSISLYFACLKDVEWQSPDNFELSCEESKDWLEESGSLSRRLSLHCQHLTVELLHNHLVSDDTLKPEEVKLLDKQDCLLREVILSGDEQPWVLGRTLIPQSTLVDQPYDLVRQGDIPLGLTVFSAETVERDALQVGWAQTPQGPLLARRSRLWMNHKPMLVAELFLPESPIYSKERA